MNESKDFGAGIGVTVVVMILLVTVIGLSYGIGYSSGRVDTFVSRDKIWHDELVARGYAEYFIHENGGVYWRYKEDFKLGKCFLDEINEKNQEN